MAAGVKQIAHFPLFDLELEIGLAGNKEGERSITSIGGSMGLHLEAPSGVINVNTTLLNGERLREIQAKDPGPNDDSNE